MFLKQLSTLADTVAYSIPRVVIQGSDLPIYCCQLILSWC